MTKAILLAALILGTLTSIKASADTYIYALDWFGDPSRVGVVDDDNADSALLCGGGVCYPIVNCNACHSQPVDRNSYAKESEMRHRKIHFPNSALRLAEGQQTKLESLRVTRMRGLLVVQDPKGRGFQLPPDAYLVKSRDDKPLFITYMGGKAPQPMR